jgi:hypothetical protein
MVLTVSFVLPGDRLLGIGRQVEGDELGRGVRRDADAAAPGRDEAVAAFESSRLGVGIELSAQLVEAPDRHGAVGRDILPAIGSVAET